MNDRQRIRLAAVAAQRLAHVAAALDAVADDGSTVMGRLRDAQGPLRGRSYEPRPRGGIVTADLAPLAGDKALRDERDLDVALEGAAKAINRATAIVGNWPPPHAATAEERRALGLGDGPWCAGCAQATGADGAPRREPVDAAYAGPLDVEGQPLWLCRWCRGCVRDWGRVPTPDEAQRHARGQRVAWPDDVPRPKEPA